MRGNEGGEGEQKVEEEEEMCVIVEAAQQKASVLFCIN